MEKLGQILIKMGKIDTEALEKALNEQNRSYRRIGQILIKMGEISESDLTEALSHQYNIPLIEDISDISTECLKVLPKKFIMRYGVIPFECNNKTIKIILSDPLYLDIGKNIEFATGKDVQPYLMNESTLASLINNYFPETIQQSIEESNISFTEEPTDTDIHSTVYDLKSEASSTPAIVVTNTILENAIKQDASDIHIEPQKNAIIVRYRIDGILKDVFHVPKILASAVTSRIKLLAGMDITIQYRPQDGALTLKYGEQKEISARVSTLPTIYGEKLVIRIIDHSKIMKEIEELGFSGNDAVLVKKYLHYPSGIILATGPTGSGKTSTLYACLNHINNQTLNIITVEDPIEYKIKGLNQVQINPKAGLTFASVLRSVLRQDPNVIMIGEIRDLETAKIAIESALTGHLVLSTLHTNSAIATITRLIDMGIEPYLIADTLRLVIAQRLVRKICNNCKSVYNISDEEKSLLNIENSVTLYRGTGCSKCLNTGYKGRTVISEVLEIDDEIKREIIMRKSETEITLLAHKNGMKILAEDAREKVIKGITTIDEVSKIVDFKILKTLNDIKSKENSIQTEIASIEESNKENAAKEEPEIADSVKRLPSIMIVDDSKTIVVMLKALFESKGFKVYHSYNSKDALELIKKGIRPDIILSDYQMPDINGETFLKILKMEEGMKNIPFVMLTSQEGTETELNILKDGADDYISKPIQPDKIYLRIRNILIRTYGDVFIFNDSE